MTAITLAFVGAGCVAAAFGLYLLLLSIAALFHSAPRPSGRPTSRLDVLVPAHDEAALIERCVRSLGAQSYPADLYRIVVVADNCSDDTAAIATSAGAHVVMVRDEPGAVGKGRALRWAMDRRLAEQPAVDAVVVVDADSIADRGFLAALSRPFEAGARAVQGESLLYSDGSASSALRAAAFLLINRVRPSGRCALGLPASGLAGNGMLLARRVLQAKPWEAFSSTEDLEYGLDLQVSGIPIAFARGAVLLSPPAPNPHAAAVQQLRWEGGKTHLARTRTLQLIAAAFRQRRPALLLTAFELALPPLGLLASGVLAGSLIGGGMVMAGLLSQWTLAPWLLAAVALPSCVLVGLVAGQASSASYRALVRAPLFVLAKPWRARHIVRFRADTWVRTERASGPGVGREP